MNRHDFTIVQTQTRPIRIIMIGAPRQLPEREHLARLDDQLLHPAGDHLQIVRFVVLVLNIIPAVRIDQSLGCLLDTSSVYYRCAGLCRTSAVQNES